MNLKCKVFLVIFIPFLLTISSLNAQYKIKSQYLNNPEKLVGFVDSCATFWLKTYDENKGGFFTNIDRDGDVISSWGRNKNMLTQSRNAYGFSKAFMLTGKEEYLQKAKQALEFMYSSAWDETNNGWFGNINEDGKSTDSQENKTAFNQHYALLGIYAYAEITGDSVAWYWFNKGFQNNESKLWDERTDYLGYFDYGNYNWSSLKNKSFNATVDAATTHLIQIYSLVGEPNAKEKYKKRLLSIADNIVDRFTSTMDNYKIGFVEKFDSDWNWNDNSSNNNTRTIMGHVLKAAWVLGRIHQVLPNQKYLDAAEKMVMDVWENGYDHVYGGPFKDYDRVTGNMFFYGQDTAKAWWQMEQAIVAGLELYDLTKNEIYLEMADESLEFFMNYFVDHTYGEVYADLFSNGSTIPQWGLNKGNGSKAGYHSIETGFYSYLYSELFVNKKDISLYYKFNPRNQYVGYRVYPLAIPSEELMIKSVERNGVDYHNFHQGDKLLIVNKYDDGIFKITFGNSSTTSIVNNNNLTENYSLEQNYPNPFNPETIIQFSLPKSGRIKIVVFDNLGRKIEEIANNNFSEGKHSVKFDASNLSSGVYFYTLFADGFHSTKKMILIK